MVYFPAKWSPKKVPETSAAGCGRQNKQNKQKGGGGEKKKEGKFCGRRKHGRDGAVGGGRGGEGGRRAT